MDKEKLVLKKIKEKSLRLKNGEVTQNELILTHLMEKKRITAAQAFTEYGCLRLAGRIFELREEGVNIETMYTSNAGKTYATYKLVEASQ